MQAEAVRREFERQEFEQRAAAAKREALCVTVPTVMRAIRNCGVSDDLAAIPENLRTPSDKDFNWLLVGWNFAQGEYSDSGVKIPYQPERTTAAAANELTIQLKELMEGQQMPALYHLLGYCFIHFLQNAVRGEVPAGPLCVHHVVNRGLFELKDDAISPMLPDPQCLTKYLKDAMEAIKKAVSQAGLVLRSNPQAIVVRAILPEMDARNRSVIKGAMPDCSSDKAQTKSGCLRVMLHGCLFNCASREGRACFDVMPELRKTCCQLHAYITRA